MASTSNVGLSHPVLFTTKTPYPLPSQKFMIPATWKRYQLSQLINKALSLSKPIPFDFLVRGEILRVSLGEWCAEKGVGEVRSFLSNTNNLYYIADLPNLCYRKKHSTSSTSSLSCRQRKCLPYLMKIGYHLYHVKYRGEFIHIWSTLGYQLIIGKIPFNSILRRSHPVVWLLPKANK